MLMNSANFATSGLRISTVPPRPKLSVDVPRQAVARVELRDGIARVDVLAVDMMAHSPWPAPWCHALMDLLGSLDDDPALSGIVLSGAGLFTTSESGTEPLRNQALAALIDTVARCAHPVVALMPHGASGAGLELALACRYRLAAPTARFVLPGIRAGILPLHGGLTRLPDLIGFELAVEMIALGRRMPGELAPKIGLVDSLDLSATGALCRQARAAPPCSERTSPPRPSRTRLQQRHGEQAPLLAFDAMRAVRQDPYAAETLQAAFRVSEQGEALAYAGAVEARLLQGHPDPAPRHVVLLAPDRNGLALARCLTADGITVSLPDTAADVPPGAGLVIGNGAADLRVFAPGGQVRLIEMAGERGRPAVAALAARIGKPAIAYPASAQPGSLAERLRWAPLREAIHMLDEGARPMQVDRALLAFGFRSAPFATADIEGLASVMASALDWDKYSPTLHLLGDAGRTGAACGLGWYCHVPGDPRPRSDERLDHLLNESAIAQRIRRRTFADEEIVSRYLAAAVAAAAREDIDAEIIDAVWNVALGFPRWRGGLLRLARAQL